MYLIAIRHFGGFIFSFPYYQNIWIPFLPCPQNFQSYNKLTTLLLWNNKEISWLFSEANVSSVWKQRLLQRRRKDKMLEEEYLCYEWDLMKVTGLPRAVVRCKVQKKWGKDYWIAVWPKSFHLLQGRHFRDCRDLWEVCEKVCKNAQGDPSQKLELLPLLNQTGIFKIK